MTRSLVRLLVPLVLALATAGAGTVAAGPVAAVTAPAGAGRVVAAPSAGTPLPACTYGNVTTPLDPAAAWDSVIIDTRIALPRTFVPPDLVSTGQAGVNTDQKLRKIVIPDLRAMAKAARASGVTIRVLSGYRSYAGQATLYRQFVALLGTAQARLRAALPGHSEHQLGTAFDVAGTPGAYTWVLRNAWRFGWVLSFPKGGTATSCMQYEPWHLRYVGRLRATLMHMAQAVPRLWLWQRILAARA